MPDGNANETAAAAVFLYGSDEPPELPGCLPARSIAHARRLILAGKWVMMPSHQEDAALVLANNRLPVFHVRPIAAP